MNPYEHCNDILCVQAGWLIEEGILSKGNYDKLTQRKWLTVERRACKGSPALVQWRSIPERFRSVIVDRFGNPELLDKPKAFADMVAPDAQAMEYYSGYLLADGRNLPAENVAEYCANASVLNAIHATIARRTAKRNSLGGGGTAQMWDNIAQSADRLRAALAHTLPANVRRLRERYEVYMRDGYASLIHKGFCNVNSRVINDQIEQLLLSLYCLPTKPYVSSVHDLYLQFLAGAVDVCDITTGELYDRNDFYDGGTPMMVSESTVWNVLNNPKNRILVDKYRTGSLEFQTTHRPHHIRDAPRWALSKISMDDRDLPRKMPDGSRVKAYYSYDVKSGYCIGASYSKSKDNALFIDCMRDMFRNLQAMNLGMPMEAEVEHHLVNNYKDDLMKAGVVFPFVRWCAPGNSQEKYAEVLNKSKKYGYEKKYQEGIGRFYAKLEANRPKVDKIFDSENNNYKDKRLSYDQLVADDKETIELYNNGLHRDQKQYKGMTRKDVMLQYVNPGLARIDTALLARYIGEHTATSIRRSQYVSVQHQKYWLPTPEVMAQLAPNNYDVDAYYLPASDGKVPMVYLYQDNAYICLCEPKDKYSTSTAERTDADTGAMAEQAKYVEKFDSMIKKSKVQKVTVVPVKPDPVLPPAEELIVPEREADPVLDFECADDDYYAQLAQNNL